MRRSILYHLLSQSSSFSQRVIRKLATTLARRGSLSLPASTSRNSTYQFSFSFQQSIMNASSNIQALLATLRLQLPDPALDLFPQSAGQFTAFPSLPIELRFKIWVHAFPAPRHVELVGPCVFGSSVFGTWAEYGPRTRGEHYKKLNALKLQFPITLEVNQESRRETLRHYRIVFPKQDLAEDGVRLCDCDNDAESECLKIPLWIDAKVDSAYFDPSLSNEVTEELLNYLWSETTDVADTSENNKTHDVATPSIDAEDSNIAKSANITGTSSVTGSSNVLSKLQMLEIRDRRSSSGFNKGILQYFTGLKTLCFTANTQEMQVRPVETTKLLQDLMPYLEQQVESGLRRAVPEVLFKDWHFVSSTPLGITDKQE